MPSVSHQLSLSDKDAETNYPYFHGTQMDVDIDKLMIERSEGDFLIQAKHISGCKRPRNFLVIKGNKNIYRTEIKKNEDKKIRVAGKTFESIKHMVDFYTSTPLDVDEEKILLIKGIARGRFHLNHKQIKIQKKIGEGSYGTVYRGILLAENTTIAIKKLESAGSDDMAIAEMMKEARVMQLYDHRNIVKFYGFIVDRLPYLLVMEYCDGGAVEDKLKAKGTKISTRTRVDMLAQAANGLEYLHSKGCIHRDIAARNCLIHKETLKLADFGMCRPTSVYKVDLEKPCNVRWLAPEVWKIGETRYNTDIYAFGIMMWELFTIPYTTPYEGWKAYKVKYPGEKQCYIKTTFKNGPYRSIHFNLTLLLPRIVAASVIPEVIRGYRLDPPDDMPADMAKLMQLAWHQKPEKRPDAPTLRMKIEGINKKWNPNGVEIRIRKTQSKH